MLTPLRHIFEASFLCTLALLILTAPALAATLAVPPQYATIQAAVNAANNGDTILVAAGTCAGPGDVDVDFLGKSITVKSASGPASTIIDCQASAATLDHPPPRVRHDVPITQKTHGISSGASGF